MLSKVTKLTTIKRRNFIKSLLGASVGIFGGGTLDALARGTSPASPKTDFGEVRSIKITCVSETGWFDSDIIKKDIYRAGGIKTNQYDIAYTEANLGGFCALLQIEALDGTITKYLLDSGWSTDWMDHAFEKSGVDKQLADGEIQTLIVSHDHNDHFFGIESTLKHCPDLTIYHPSSILKKSSELLDGADFSATPGCPVNRFPHTGKRVPTLAGKLYIPQEGMAIVPFDVDIPLGVRGENVIYVKVKDKGYVVITGCGHPGVSSLISYPERHFKNGDSLYGCYGGLHIAPLEVWAPWKDKTITQMQQAKIKKIACNHCTGRIWSTKARQAGLPVVKGTDEFRSYNKVAKLAQNSSSNLYIGNGDSVTF